MKRPILNKIKERRQNLRNKKTEPQKLFEDTPNLEKLYVYIAIVPSGHANEVINLFQHIGSSAQYVQIADGTAPNKVANILSITDNEKEVVWAFLKDSKVEEAQTELEAYFASSKKTAGIGFAIPLTSILGVRMYKFLAQTF